MFLCDMKLFNVNELWHRKPLKNLLWHKMLLTLWKYNSHKFCVTTFTSVKCVKNASCHSSENCVTRNCETADCVTVISHLSHCVTIFRVKTFCVTIKCKYF